METKKQIIQISKKGQNSNVNKELSYTHKCMILANLSEDKKRKLINSFDNIPLIKLYTANLKQENFIYSKIKGALCFTVEEENKNFNYYLQIYDITDFSLAFNLQINQKMIKDIIKIEKDENFFCIPTKFHFLGFRFLSKESMMQFLKIFTCESEPDKKVLDINLKGRDFKCAYKDILKVSKEIKTDFEKKFKTIDNISGKIEKEKEKNIFQKFDELNYIVNCIEYDEENKIFNLFIDKTFNPRIIQSYIDTYKNSKNKNLLNLRIIYDDYTHIYNKETYIDLLINNLMNNFTEANRLIIFKREHKKRHDKEDFEESKRINSEYYISKSSVNSSSKDNSEKIRNSAIIPNNNELKRKGNIAGKNNLKQSTTFNKIDSIKEEPEEDIDHLKKFNEKEKDKNKITKQ